jgi:hypothetical protein
VSWRCETISALPKPHRSKSRIGLGNHEPPLSLPGPIKFASMNKFIRTDICVAMARRQNNNHGLRGGCARLARLSRCRLPLSVMAVVAVASLAIETAHAQSDTVKKSNELLQDILRNPPPSQRGGAARETTAPSTTTRKGGGPVTLNGHWLVRQKCNQGQFEVELNITHSSPTEFSGTSKGITTGHASTIVNGQLKDGNVTFTRMVGPLSDRWTAKMSGPGRFNGTSAGPGYTCSYTAVRQRN